MLSVIGGLARSALRRAMISVLALSAVSSVARLAWGVPCGRPDLLEAIPPNGATDVPLNATPSARYAQTAEYLNEEVTLEQIGTGTVAVTTSFNRNESTLTVTPAATLEPQSDY